MRILSVYIETFGCLKQKEFKFGEGLNTVFLENGEGKTTVAAFIKAMFYGLEGTRNKKVEDNEYLKYKPFEGGVLGGALTFEKDNKEYRIQRYFDLAKNGKEDFKLYCGGVQCGDFSGNIGEELFGLNAEGFEKSVYLPQKAVDRKVNDSITARLSSLIEQEEDKYTCDDALKLLDAKRREYKLEKGKGGKIFTQEREIFRLNGELNQSRESKIKVASIAITQREIEKSLQEIALQIKQLEEKINKVNLCEHKKRLKEEYGKLQSACAEIENTQRQFLGEYNSLDNIQSVAQRINYLKDALAELESRQNEQSAALQRTQTQNKSADKKTMALCLPLWALSLILILSGVFTITSSTAAGVSLLVLGFIALFIGAFVFIFHKITGKTQVNQRESIDPAASQIIQIKDELREKTIKYGDIALLFEKIENFKRSGVELQEKIKRQNEITQDKEFDANFIPFAFTAQELEAQKEIKRKEAEKLSSDLNTLKIQLKEQELQAEKEFYILLSLKEEEERLKVYEEEFEAIKSAMAFLAQARENLKRAYLPKMNESFKKYTKYFLSARELCLDNELDIILNYGGKTQSGEHLSKGEWDLADFCCRLSLAEALSKSQTELLILDDPFVNFDDTRVNLAKKLVCDLSQEYQIIYFTCHTSRKI